MGNLDIKGLIRDYINYLVQLTGALVIQQCAALGVHFY